MSDDSKKTPETGKKPPASHAMPKDKWEVVKKSLTDSKEPKHNKKDSGNTKK